MNLCEKKVLLILTDINMGGVTTAAVNFCKGLVERGNLVDVLIMSNRNNCDKSCFGEGINFLNLSGKDRLWDLNLSVAKSERNVIKKASLYILGAFKKLINKDSRWIRFLFGTKKRFCGYDIAIAYRQCAPCYHFALNCVEADKKVAFVHGDINYMGDISTWQKYMSDFNVVAYVSDAVKAGFIERYPELAKNAVTIYNVFDVEGIRSKAQVPCDVEFQNQKFNIVTVSRIENTMKGTNRIPYVCEKLKKMFGNTFRWYVVGDGPGLDECQRLSSELSVSDCLAFLGARQNPYNILAKSDICVLPTLSEAFPMIVGESLILSVPIVTSRYPAATEIIEEGINGLIAEQSIDSLFDRVSLLMKDKTLYDKIKRECMSFTYNNDRSYNKLTEAFNR